MHGATRSSRPRLTSRSLVGWAWPLVRSTPFLLSAYLVPGRLPPRVREAAMLGVTSINRCEACEAVHGRWADRIGVRTGDLRPDEAAAWDFGQRLAVGAPGAAALPDGLSRRHRGELVAVATLMELANLAGNRFLGDRATAAPGLQVGDHRTARLLDAGMRAADRAGLRRARTRIAGTARGRVLEIGVGTGSNLPVYPEEAEIHGLDVSAPALAVAADRARRSGRTVALLEGDAASLPFPDATFDAVVGTFVLCSVGDVDRTLREVRRVLRPGGTIRLLEHARSRHPLIGATQDRAAPAWARLSGGCRLDHDVHASVREAGFRPIEQRSHAGGVLVEIIAA